MQLEPLALLEAPPEARTLTSRRPVSEKPASLLSASAYAHFVSAWSTAAGIGVVPPGPFDPALFQCYSNVVLSGGTCRETNVVLHPPAACEVTLRECRGDVWQPQPAVDSSTESEGSESLDDLHVVSSKPGKTGTKGASAGRSGGRSHRALPASRAKAAASLEDDTDDDAEGVRERAVKSLPASARVLRSGSAAVASSKRSAVGLKRLKREGRNGSDSGSDADDGHGSSSGSCRTVQGYVQGGNVSSDDRSSDYSEHEKSDAGASAPAQSALRSRSSLKLACADRRLRRRMSCDPVVRLRLVFEYRERSLVFAYRYSGVPEMDAFTELGSRDFTIRECLAAGAVILPVADIVRPRRRVPVPKDQVPLSLQESWSRQAEYLWFQ